MQKMHNNLIDKTYKITFNSLTLSFLTKHSVLNLFLIFKFLLP